MNHGICKLCLLDKPLCDSHLIPRSVYALCRATKAPNPNPFLVTNQFAMQTSRQMQVPLLCFACEQLLRERGEDWVVPELARYPGPFPFFEKLRATPPLYNEPDFVAYLLATVPNIRVAELIHFFMGIFWKASVHPWRKGRSDMWITLGQFSEPIRTLLRGEAPFPENVALSITVLPPPVTLIAFHPPYETIGPDPTYHLYVSGFNCTLSVGERIEPELVLSSIHRPPHHLLIVDNAADITRKFRDSYESAKAKGKAKPIPRPPKR